MEFFRSLPLPGGCEVQSLLKGLFHLFCGTPVEECRPFCTVQCELFFPSCFLSVHRVDPLPLLFEKIVVQCDFAGELLLVPDGGFDFSGKFLKTLKARRQNLL